MVKVLLKEKKLLSWAEDRTLCIQEQGNSFKQKGLVCTKFMTTRFTRGKYLAFYSLLFEKQVSVICVRANIM